METYKYIKCHDTLNPKIWNNFVLKPEIEKKVIEIANQFADNLRKDDVKFDLRDIMLVGSNVNYNYNQNSDLDVHLIVKLNSASEEDTILKQLYNYYKNSFNKLYSLTIYGIQVELYVETEEDNATNISNGKYSIYDGWIKKPIKEEIKINIHEINSIYEKYVDEFNDLKEKISFETPDNKINEIDKFIDKIYTMRKDSLSKEGEFGVGNMVFKELRAKGYIEILRELKTKIIDNKLSLK